MIYRGIFAQGIYGIIRDGKKLGDIKLGLVLIGFSLLVIMAAYLVGSLNFAVIISKLKYGQDIRDFGSGNGGTTNMLRTYGKKTGAVTLVCDMLKAIASVTFGCLFLGLTFGGYLAAFFCMLGHMFPIYYKFKGGKGVAVIAASVLVLNPPVFAILFVCFAVIVGGTKYVSLGSVMSVLLFPVLLNTMNEILFPYLLANDIKRLPPVAGEELKSIVGGTDVIFAVLIAVFVVFMHRENIKRLMAGTESKLSFGKKKSESGEKEKK